MVERIKTRACVQDRDDKTKKGRLAQPSSEEKKPILEMLVREAYKNGRGPRDPVLRKSQRRKQICEKGEGKKNAEMGGGREGEGSGGAPERTKQGQKSCRKPPRIRRGTA